VELANYGFGVLRELIRQIRSIRQYVNLTHSLMHPCNHAFTQTNHHTFLTSFSFSPSLTLCHMPYALCHIQMINIAFILFYGYTSIIQFISSYHITKSFQGTLSSGSFSIYINHVNYMTDPIPGIMNSGKEYTAAFKETK